MSRRSSAYYTPASSVGTGQMPEAVETAAKAAVAAAGANDRQRGCDDRPMQPKPSLFPDTAGRVVADGRAVGAGRVHPASAGTNGQATPTADARIDELPVLAQNELRMKRGDAPPPASGKAADGPVAAARLSASVAAVKKPFVEPPQSARSARPARSSGPGRMPARPAPRPPELRAPEPISEYAWRARIRARPARPTSPVHTSVDMDQLDIPVPASAAN